MSQPLQIGSLFSGYGGLDLAVEAVTGAQPAWFVEFDAAPSKILQHHWPDVPNLGDVTAVQWDEVPRVDILTGGTPCQDLSEAGKRAGMTEGTRSNLWVNMREAIIHLAPRLVVWENVQGALSAKATSDSDMEQGGRPLGDGGGGHLRALGRVLGDLAEIGLDAEWTTIRASDVGAPHHRARVFLVAWPQEVSNPESLRRDNGQATHDGQTDREVHSPRHDSDTAANSRTLGSQAGGQPKPGAQKESGADDRFSSFPDSENNGYERPGEAREGWHGLADGHNRTVEWGRYAPAVRRWERAVGPAPAPTELNTRGKPRLAAEFAEWMMGLPAGWVTGVPGLSRADQIKAIGNGVVPQQAAAAIEHLLSQTNEENDHDQ